MGKSKAIGTRGETKVRKYLSDGTDLVVRRKVLAGSNDEGDLEVEVPVFPNGKLVLEVKCGRQSSNPARGTIDRWLCETAVEGLNCQCMSALIILRYNRAIENADVYMLDKSYDIHKPVHMFMDDFKQYLASVSKL
jgi:hypothetical protein